MTTPVDARPMPLKTLADLWGPVHSLAAAGITAATTLGILSSKTGGLLSKGLGTADVLMAAVLSALAGAAPMLATRLVANQGKHLVTPVSDPRNNEGQPLSA